MKLDLSVRRIIVYTLIVGLGAGAYFLGGYFLVDKGQKITFLTYSLIAYPAIGVLKYLALLKYWRRLR